MNQIPLIDVNGSPRERGRQQGEGARKQVCCMLSAYRAFPWGAQQGYWENAKEKAKEFLSSSLYAFPDLVEELKGIAEGANVCFDEILLLNCFEEIYSASRIASCSNIALGQGLTENGHVLLAHNEDWISLDRDNIYLVRSAPQGQPSFLGLTYGGLLVNIGFNEEGIGVAINSVFHRDSNIAVPRIVYSRNILAALSLEDAISRSTFKDRSGGYNFTLASADGKVCCVECSAGNDQLIFGKNEFIAHTNHYLSAEMQLLEETGDYSGSRARLDRIQEFIKIRSPNLKIEDLQYLLKDHKNHPDSICSHEKDDLPPFENTQTIGSLIMDLTDKKMWVAPGNPCCSDYFEYSINQRR